MQRHPILHAAHKLFLKSLPEKQRIAYLHWRYHGRWPNLRAPRSFNEKLCWRKLHLNNPALSVTADKIAVRSFVADKVGSDHLTRLYGVFSDPKQILFDSLPSRYVVKANHGSGWNYFVTSPASLDQADLIRTAQGWLMQRYDQTGGEWWYGKIAPMLMVEEFLDGENGEAPNDYKFFVFRGEVAMIQVDLDRFSNHSRNLYDQEWRQLPCNLKYPQGPSCPRPRKLSEMLKIAGVLGKDFDFVRVDLYEVGERIVFGELTHCPGSGWERFSDQQYDLWLGDLLRLDHNDPQSSYK